MNFHQGDNSELVGAAGDPVPLFTRIRLHFVHLDIPNRNPDIWLPSKRYIVTPAVCPHLFKFLTTLTFGTLRNDHIVSTTFETTEKRI